MRKRLKPSPRATNNRCCDLVPNERIRRAFPAVLIIATLLIPLSALAEKGQVVDRIAAVVGSEIVLLSEVLGQAAPAMKELKKSSQGGPDLMEGKRTSKIVQETLGHIIDEKLVGVEARQMKLSVTSEEIDRAIANMARENSVDVKTLIEAVKAQGLDLLTYRSKLRNQILRFKVLNLRIRGRVKISDAEARQFYNDQVRDVRATVPFEGAHILIRIQSNARAAEAALAWKRAEAVSNRIKAGEDFAVLAKKESEDAITAARGGSLGMQESGTIPSVLNRAFLDMEVGEINGPVRTAAGFHIIRLNNRETMGVQPFSEVKERITAQLAQKEMVRQEKIWLKELKLKTFVDIRL